MTDGPETAGEAADGGHKRVRADAQRSLDALLQAAKTVFMTTGVDAPVREIADKAGVGIGTLYRHFPQRSDLITAVFEREVDACEAAAAELAGQYEPGVALAKWIERYLTFVAAKRGLAKALHSGDPAYELLPAHFVDKMVPALRGLLDAAVGTGSIRSNVDAEALLTAIANLSRGGPELAQPMVALLIDGLRYGAKPEA